MRLGLLGRWCLLASAAEAETAAASAVAVLLLAEDVQTKIVQAATKKSLIQDSFSMGDEF